VCEHIVGTWKAFKAHGRVQVAQFCWMGGQIKRSRIIINFLVAFPKRTMFLKFIDASSHVTDVNLIYSLLADVVKEVGVKTVVQIITNNTANYVANEIFCAKYPTIFWTLCFVHCIDLILEDIGKLEWVQDILRECKRITKYVYNHAWVLNFMVKFTEGELNHPIVTCFATNFLSLKALLMSTKH
jgi:hypothetical protein